MSRSALLRSGLLASVLVLLPASFAAADDLLKDATNSEIAVRADGDGYQVTTTNRRFETDIFTVALDSSKKLPGINADGVFEQVLMIEQIDVTKEGPSIDTETVSKKVKVTAYALSKEGKGPVRFTIEGEGDEVQVEGNYLAITRWGCCGDLNTHAVYSMETGAYLFNATGDRDETGDWATLDEKGGWANSRIVSYHVTPTMDDDKVLAGAPYAAAVINYASQTAPIQRILVTLPKKLIDDDAPGMWDPKLLLIAKSQPKGDISYFAQTTDEPEKAYNGVTARLALDAKTVIVIPIKGDRLDVAHATLPQGFALKEMPIAPAKAVSNP
ncbi:MAG TPA: hypothetical protein VGM59_05795 [Dongiaceae bacterium]|jgi:hypothetical protein